jgi:hypothetical protein
MAHGRGGGRAPGRADRGSSGAVDSGTDRSRGRNTLLYYKDRRAGTLDLAAADPDLLDRFLSTGSVRLNADVYSRDPGRLAAATGDVDGIALRVPRGPVHRAGAVAQAAALAKTLGCVLVTLHSGKWTTASKAAERFWRDVDLIAIDVPEPELLRLPDWQTSRLLVAHLLPRRGHHPPQPGRRAEGERPAGHPQCGRSVARNEPAPKSWGTSSPRGPTGYWARFLSKRAQFIDGVLDMRKPAGSQP